MLAFPTIGATMFRMACPIAVARIDDYTKAVAGLVEATDKLSALLERHEEFAEAKKQMGQSQAKCNEARRALEQHWAEHGCRTSDPSSGGPGDLR